MDDGVLRLLALRQRQLLNALSTRGHAATAAIQLDAGADSSWRQGTLPAALRQARAHRRWSSLNANPRLQETERQNAVERLTAELV